MKDLVPPSLSVSRYLDVGCAEGAITASFGDEMKLDSKQIFGCDILPIKNTEGFTFSQLIIPDKLPYETGQFHCITALMSLHHMVNPEGMLKEIHRY